MDRGGPGTLHRDGHLNPFFSCCRLGLSELGSSLAGDGLYSAVARLYARVFCGGKMEDVPTSLFKAFDNYPAVKGRFGDNVLEIKERLRQSERKNESLDPIMVWALCKEDPLRKLANHVLRVVPNRRK